SRWEARGTGAAGGARGGEVAVEGGRPFAPTAALAVGGLGRAARRRQAVAERQHAGVGGAALGTVRAHLPRLRQLPGLSEVEPIAQLFSDGGLLRHAPRRRTAH